MLAVAADGDCGEATDAFGVGVDAGGSVAVGEFNAGVLFVEGPRPDKS